MAATTAPLSRWLDERHAAIKEAVLQQVEDFRAEHDFEPPYWQLLAIAAQVVPAD